MRIAALTMSYNEPVWARVWARHYSRQVGAENCFLLDHGSDDGSTTGLGVRVERLPRSPLDEEARAERIGERARALLERYDAVVHSDTDELLVADPARYTDLVAFASSVPDEVVTAIGLDLQHVASEEGPLDPWRPIGEQRRWVRFSAAMCKPAFVRRPVRWAPGFHSCDFAAITGGLFLFHLRYADTGIGVERLRRTRQQAFATAETNPHQRVSDDTFVAMVSDVAQLPRRSVPFTDQRGPMAAQLMRIAIAREQGESWLPISGDELWELPDAFAARL